ncbi:MAG: flagellar protein FlgN [Candidatus Sericytochromatia bacterium]|nr:flagellar protein FlgN [Candidatus Sericytochromatia bacterium]
MPALSELHALLQRQLGLCRRLLLVLKLTRQTLTKADATPLEDCIAQQAAIGAELAEVDAARQDVTMSLAIALGLSEATLLPELFGALPGPDVAPLATLATELATVVGEIQRVQQVNQTLLQHALEYVDFNMEIIAEVERQLTASPTYNPYGQQAVAYADPPERSALNLNA